MSTQDAQPCGCGDDKNNNTHKIVLSNNESKKITSQQKQALSEVLGLPVVAVDGLMMLFRYKQEGVLHKGPLEQCEQMANALGQRGVVVQVKADSNVLNSSPSILK